MIIELGLNNVNNTISGYTKATKPVDKTIPENASFFKNRFNLEVTEINQKFWNSYWTPKFHKNLLHPSRPRNHFRTL